MPRNWLLSKYITIIYNHANELITPVQSLNILHLSLLNYVVSNFLSYATDFSCTVSGFGQSLEVRYYCNRC